jgi:hypothetical protein
LEVKKREVPAGCSPAARVNEIDVAQCHHGRQRNVTMHDGCNVLDGFAVTVVVPVRGPEALPGRAAPLRQPAPIDASHVLPVIEGAVRMHKTYEACRRFNLQRNGQA